MDRKVILMMNENGVREQIEITYEEVLKKFQNLAYKKAREFNYIAEMFGEYDFEDLVQEANIGLYEAYISYDDTKNYVFSTLATRCIENRYKLIIRSKNRQKREGEKETNISLDKKSSFGDGDEGRENYESIEAEYITNNLEENVISSILMEEINSELTEREKIYLLILIKEIKAIRVAEDLGISRAAVHKGLLKTKKKIKYLLEEKFLKY